jgi:hypothetical protein
MRGRGRVEAKTRVLVHHPAWYVTVMSVLSDLFITNVSYSLLVFTQIAVCLAHNFLSASHFK